MEEKAIKPEVKYCSCNNCSKDKHIQEARYCSRCGTKLEQIPVQ